MDESVTNNDYNEQLILSNVRIGYDTTYDSPHTNGCDWKFETRKNVGRLIEPNY